jgi:hypothetical protein
MSENFTFEQHAITGATDTGGNDDTRDDNMDVHAITKQNGVEDNLSTKTQDESAKPNETQMKAHSTLEQPIPAKGKEVLCSANDTRNLKSWVPVLGEPAGTPKEEEEAALGKRPRNTSGDGAAQAAKRPKVEDAAKAERLRQLKEKKKLLESVQKELDRLRNSPKTSTPTSTTATPAPVGARGGRARARGEGLVASGGRGNNVATPEKDEPGLEAEPMTPTETTSAGPATSTRKRKPSNAGGAQRRVSQELTSEPGQPVTRAKRARRPKRLDSYGGSVNLSWALKQCQTLLKSLMTHKFGWPFNQPVDPIALNIPDYFDVIKQPMDLGTIKEQLDTGHYETEDEFAEDVRLVWANTFTYNPPGSDICVMASALSGIFNEKFEILKAKIAERGRGSPAGIDQTLQELRESMSSVRRELERIKTPNGRAAARGAPREDARPMSFSEKKKLSDAINVLPSEHLGTVVKIIHERMPHLTTSGEEIEIDIDALNPVTLRHLERYVRSVAQRRRRAGGRASLNTSTNVQNEVSQVPLGTKQKIEDVERQIKALTEHQQALTQKSLARSSESSLQPAVEDTKKKKKDDESDSESDSEGSDSSDSSDSESSDSESDSGSDSDSESSDSEAQTTKGTDPPPASDSAPQMPVPSGTNMVGVVGEEKAASATAPATTTTPSALGGEGGNAHQDNGQTNTAISFSFDPTLAKEPIKGEIGPEELQQQAAVDNDSPSKSEAPKQVALKNVDAWSELSDDFGASKRNSPSPTQDKTWSQFQTKKRQDSIREREKLEKEERERKEKERREEEKRQGEERRRREQEEAELAAQRERERQRQEERLAREQDAMSIMEQSMLMASLEQQAAPIQPLFQYKRVEEEEADFNEGTGEGTVERAKMELSPTAPLPVPASDEMEEGQI